MEKHSTVTSHIYVHVCVNEIIKLEKRNDAIINFLSLKSCLHMMNSV
jgi:hypothetical protein